MDIKQIASGVVIGPGNKIVLVSQNGDSWSLPKGHLEPGEDEEEAVIREIFEETGIQDVKIINTVGEYERARIGKNGIGETPDDVRHISVFLCITNQEELQPIDPENPAAEWLAIQDVADRLTHPKDKEFFASITPKILKFLAS
jgi:ADP-ribose pyrophosphatase YjhB (NUDIX family)